MCMAESLCFAPETITTLLIGYTPTQNKSLKTNKVELMGMGSLHAPQACGLGVRTSI